MSSVTVNTGVVTSLLTCGKTSLTVASLVHIRIHTYILNPKHCTKKQVWRKELMQLGVETVHDMNESSNFILHKNINMIKAI